MASNCCHMRSIARVQKARPCSWCRMLISKGQPALRLAEAIDGSWIVQVLHSDCADVWERDGCEEGCTYPHARGMTCGETDKAASQQGVDS